MHGSAKPPGTSGRAFESRSAASSLSGSLERDGSIDVLWSMMNEDREPRMEDTMSLLSSNDSDGSEEEDAASISSVMLGYFNAELA